MTTPGSGNFPSTDTWKKIEDKTTAEITVKTAEEMIPENVEEEMIPENAEMMFDEEMIPENVETTEMTAETTEEMTPENAEMMFDAMTPENAIMKDVNTMVTDVLSTELTTPMLTVAPVAAKDQTKTKEETKTTTEDLAVPVAHLLGVKQNKEDEKLKKVK